MTTCLLHPYVYLNSNTIFIIYCRIKYMYKCSTPQNIHVHVHYLENSFELHEQLSVADTCRNVTVVFKLIILITVQVYG